MTLHEALLSGRGSEGLLAAIFLVSAAAASLESAGENYSTPGRRARRNTRSGIDGAAANAYQSMMRMRLNKEFVMKKFFAAALTGLCLGGFLPHGPAAAADETYTIAISNHRFEPAELQVPAGKKFKLTVKNQDATPEEFESDEMHIEKVIPGKTDAVILVGPLKPGTYPFMGEFHEDTAKGTLVAK